MDDVTNLYVYRTGRDDGMDFCVGAIFRDDRVDGMVALFQTRYAAELFMGAMRNAHGMAVQVRPSAGGE